MSQDLLWKPLNLPAPAPLLQDLDALEAKLDSALMREQTLVALMADARRVDEALASARTARNEYNRQVRRMRLSFRVLLRRTLPPLPPV